MTWFGWLRARPRTLASAGVLVVGAVALTTMAFAYQGKPTTQVELNDGGVWVTKQSTLMVGHLNHESQVIDGGLSAASARYDVLQAGSTVVLHDESASTAAVIDPAAVKVTTAAKLPAGTDVELGGKAVAVLDGRGYLWVVPASGLGGFRTSTVKPVAKLGRGAAVAVGRDGVVHAVSPSRSQLITIPTDAQGDPGDVGTQGLDGLTASAKVSITAVGGTGVVLDSTHSRILGSGLDTAIDDGAQAVLQQPSDQADAVLVETPTALERVPLGGGAPTRTTGGGDGIPAAPVYVQGCAYAVWSGSLRFVRDCPGTKDDVSRIVPGADPSAQLQFRVNRDVVVLNDIVGGASWLAADSMKKIDNWADLTPPPSQTEKVETKPDAIWAQQATLTKDPPIVVDDHFGVRAGRTVYLPVLQNDSDPGGGVLTVSLPSGGSHLGTVQPIENGAALQIAVNKDATGSDSFEYRADNGHGGSKIARVHLDVVPPDDNHAPKQERITTVPVEAGGQTTYNVLPDWLDPDGDDMYLAEVDAMQGDSVDFSPDGKVTYHATSGLTGIHDVKVIVSDGTDTGTGVIRLDVRPAGTPNPIANAAHVMATAGQALTVNPLRGDIGTGIDPLRLTTVGSAGGATVVPNYDNNTFSFRAASPGTYYVPYSVASGIRSASSFVRVDVIAGASSVPLVAVRDVAMLPAGGQVVADPLANDSDPLGGVLVLQNVSVPTGAGVAATVVAHNQVRITDQGSTGGQIQLQYTISNGSQSATGEISVIKVAPPSKLRAPVANKDTAVVRAGDVVTIPVLDNDYSPIGSPIHVMPDLVPPLPTAKQGEAFVSQDTVRFRAGSTPGTTQVTYQIIDGYGQKVAAQASIQILPATNDGQAPRPIDVTARTLSGTQVQVPITLDGIDPNGSSVELVGIASAPTKGTVTAVGENSLTYQAFGDATGLDTFTYLVRDRMGLEGTASVRVGIAPQPTTGTAPFAGKDTVLMRPGRTIAADVMANDSDPGGNPLHLVAGGLIVPKVDGLSAQVVGGRVYITAPNREMTATIQYTVANSLGMTAIGAIAVTASPSAPLLPPVANDIWVRTPDVRKGDTAQIDVRANASDPNGTPQDLKVTADPGVKVGTNGKVQVQVTAEAQVIGYTVTNPDGLAASAFVFVPARADLIPALSTTAPVTVHSGEQVRIPLAAHIIAAGGKTVRITEAAKVSAVHSDGGSLMQDPFTLSYRSAAKYTGDDAITLEVTDGTGPDDPNGRKATLSIPIVVLPPAGTAVAPTFTDGQVTVAPGEPATSVDLRALTQDDDPKALPKIGYAISGTVPPGFTAQVAGGTLKLGAASSTPKGTTATIGIAIKAPGAPEVQGAVTATVTASTRPLPVAANIDLGNQHQGTTITVPVFDHDFNPFPDKPLTLMSAVGVSGDVLASVAGDSVRIVIAKSFVGAAVASYVIRDATGDPSRQATGQISFTVQGKPDTPSTPSVVSVGSRTVVLQWQPPSDNGAAITSYLVKATAGGFQQTCPSTLCTLTGLTNNTNYSFTVTAVNSVGSSAPSPASQSVRPDVRPDTPNAPTLKFGDSSLQVAWQTPTTQGSPVTSYNLQISPAPASGSAEKDGVTGNSLTWAGLENGVAYQVRVQARNSAPDPSSWSAWSASEIPAKVPDAPAAPTTAALSPVGDQAQMQVSWNVPANNGDAVAGYQLRVLQGGQVKDTIVINDGTTTSQAVVIDTSTTDYTFAVQAKNKAGWGAWSPESAPRRAVVAPGAPTDVQASTPSGNSTIKVSYTPASGNGATASETSYQYSLNGNGWNALNGTTISGVSNGTTYTVRLRAVSTVEGQQYTGAASANSNAVVPYGPVNTPSVSARNNGQSVTLTWTAPAQNGRSISKVQISVDGGGWQDAPSLSGNKTVGNGYDQTHSIKAKAQDAAGQWSAVSGTASATTDQPPAPKATASRGTSAQGQPNCTSSSCAYGVLTVNQYFKSGTYTLTCNGDGPNGGTWGSRSYYIAAGSTTQLTCYYGDPGAKFWIAISGGDPGSTPHITW